MQELQQIPVSEEFLKKLLAGKRIGRSLTDMPKHFRDKNAVAELLGPNPLLYEVYSIEEGGVLADMTIMRPGTIGQEFIMTKGHFHEDDSGELYYGLKGHGVLVLQNRHGMTAHLEIKPGVWTRVPDGFAHRSVNVGDEPLAFVAVYGKNAGHDYGVQFKKCVFADETGWKMADAKENNK